MKKELICRIVCRVCLPIFGICLQQSHAETLPASQGIVIFNVNDNSSRSADALLHVLKDILLQKDALHKVAPVAYSHTVAVGENQSTYKVRSFNIAQLGIGASSITALVTWLKIKFLTNKTFRNGYWGTWRSDIPLQVLIELPDRDIVTELFPALHAYYDPGAIREINTFTVVQMFLTDINKEQELLSDLLWWYNALRLVGLYRFFGNEEIEHKIEKRYQRLELLKHCISEWANTCLCQDSVDQVDINNVA